MCMLCFNADNYLTKKVPNGTNCSLTNDWPTCESTYESHTLLAPTLNTQVNPENCYWVQAEKHKVKKDTPRHFKEWPQNVFVAALSRLLNEIRHDSFLFSGRGSQLQLPSSLTGRQLSHRVSLIFTLGNNNRSSVLEERPHTLELCDLFCLNPHHLSYHISQEVVVLSCSCKSHMES